MVAYAAGVAAVLCALLSLGMAQNETSGSGSGSGMPAARSCRDLNCQHICNENSGVPACYCRTGYTLAADMTSCQSCPGGLYGVSCSERCNCSTGGNNCDNVNGTCLCNSCYGGANCEIEREDYTCFVQFLGVRDKRLNPLRDLYGSTAYPLPPNNQLERLVGDGLLEISTSFVQNVNIVPINRDEVDQGPLVSMRWRVDKTMGSARADEGLNTLRNKVKLGDIAATLIIQDGIETAEVTLNAGIKRDNSN